MRNRSGGPAFYYCINVHICKIRGMKKDEAKARADILKALAHPVRVIAVEALRRGDRCVCEIQPLVDVDPSTLSRHLAILKRAGIVGERREGVKVIHHLACPCILQALDCTVGVLKADVRQRRAVLAGRERT